MAGPLVALREDIPRGYIGVHNIEGMRGRGDIATARGGAQWHVLRFPNALGDQAGTRNYVLIIPAFKMVHIVASRVTQYVTGTKTVITGGEPGRTKKDRQRLARIFVGLAKNPNTYATIVLGVKRKFGYSELHPDTLAHEIAAAGKPVEVLTVEDSGGVERLLEHTTTGSPFCSRSVPRPAGASAGRQA